jgi:hypothetical protein
MLKVICAIILALSVAGPAAAFAVRHDHGPPPSHPNKPTPTAAPEIDPAGAMGAFTLLAGGLAVLRGRRSRQQ